MDKAEKVEITRKMNPGVCLCKYKLYVLLASVAILTILSQQRLLLDTLRSKLKSNAMDLFDKHMTTDVHEEIIPTAMKSEVLKGNHSRTHLYVPKSNLFEMKIKPNLMELINGSAPKFALTINGSYLLENKNRCSKVSNLTLIIMVLSAPKHFQRRNLIRKTWGNGIFYSSLGRAEVVFLLGIVNDSKVQSNIMKEFKVFGGDIVQGSFIDSYRNLSHKSVMGFKWATERCKNAKYVIKTDDDIVLNIFRVLKIGVNVLSLNQYHVLCQHKTKAGIIRSKRSKYYVESNQFKGKKYYPSYCEGKFVMMLNDIIPLVFESASRSPLFWIDDVFMYGIVLNNISALKYKNLKREEYGSNKTCWTREKPKCNYIYYAMKDSEQTTEIWSYIMKQYARL